MTIKTAILVFCLGLLFSPNPATAIELSCPQLQTFVENMYELGDFIEDNRLFEETPRFEEGMEKVFEILEAIAQDEEKYQFTSTLQEMRRIWDLENWSNRQRDAFRRAFDATSVGLGRISNQHCK